MPPSLEKVLFLAASALTDEAERRLLLDRACGDDAALRARVDALFAIQAEATNYLEARAASGSDEVSLSSEPAPFEAQAATETGAEALGARVGRYRLLRRVGEGGCGVVYLAEQVEPVRREVALKIIRPGMDTERVVARFEAERRSLALMDHPHIARVLDAGATASGLPYFVMEFVDGRPITDFCDAQRLPVRARLGLFVQLCLALQHAHQKGVIHRDIKPSNILVREHDGRPFVQVIDFGIAKATRDPAAGSPGLTRADQPVGTPAYLSPEMAAGSVDLDTRSDIHALGVVLHELLTGATPFARRAAAAVAEAASETGAKAGDGGDAGAVAAELRRLLREESPSAPSASLSALPPEELRRVAGLRRAEPAKLIEELRGELDWIALKAMERERERRYETAHGLALDVERHLRHEPVVAGPPARLYRVRKFLRRNRLTVAAGLAVASALAGGTGVATWMYLREQRARAAEAALRERAEHRELVAQAAVRVSHGDLTGADTLLARVPFDQAPLSLEAARTYSAVGEWHVLAGRWREATERFATQALVLPRVDVADSDAISITLLPAVATLAWAGDTERRDALRTRAWERFGDTSRPVVAEQVLKACLLTPPSAGFTARLAPLAARLERALREGHPELDKNPSRVAWSCFALGLFSHRAGEPDRARMWTLRCLEHAGANPSRDASARCLLALIAAGSGEDEPASRMLDEAREAVEGFFDAEPRLGNVNSFWFDWVVARVLLREAGDAPGARAKKSPGARVAPERGDAEAAGEAGADAGRI